MSADFARALTDGTEGYAASAAHVGGVEAAARLWTRVEQAGDVWTQLHPVDRENRLACARAVLDATAETILAEAEVACAGLHVASPERGRIMALARRFAEAVRA